MNIHDLLDRYKNEIKWLPLKEVANLVRGKNLTKKEFILGDIPVVSGGVKPSGYHNQANRDGDVISVSSSGSAGTILYWKKPIYLSDAFSIKAKDNKAITSFLYYCLKCHQDYFYTLSRGMIPHFYIKDIQDFLIPLPSLETQKAIVKVLDGLESTANSYQEEAECREKAFKYGVEQILSFPEDIAKANIREVFNVRVGYTPSKSNKAFWTDGTIPWFRVEDIRNSTTGHRLTDAIQKINIAGVKSGKLFPAKSLILSTSATIGVNALIQRDFICNQRFHVFSLTENYKEKLDIDFLYYYSFVLSEWSKENAFGHGNCRNVVQKSLYALDFPLPSQAQQKECVNKLKGLEALYLACREAAELYKKALTYTMDKFFYELIEEESVAPQAS